MGATVPFRHQCFPCRARTGGSEVASRGGSRTWRYQQSAPASRRTAPPYCTWTWAQYAPRSPCGEHQSQRSSSRGHRHWEAATAKRCQSNKIFFNYIFLDNMTNTVIKSTIQGISVWFYNAKWQNHQIYQIITINQAKCFHQSTYETINFPYETISNHKCTICARYTSFHIRKFQENLFPTTEVKTVHFNIHPTLASPLSSNWCLMKVSKASQLLSRRLPPTDHR